MIPSGIGVSTEGDRLVFRSSYSAGRAGSYACQWVHQGHGLARSECRGAWLAFSDLQDFVEGETTEPLPDTTSPPTPDVRIGAGRVIVRIGGPQAPDLAMTPLLVEEQ